MSDKAAAMTSPSKPSRTARLSAARLAAVQAVYQKMATGQDAAHIIDEYKDRRLGEPVDGEAMVKPDDALFTAIVAGVEARHAELEALLTAAEQQVPAEPLLRAIMLCGAWELLAQPQTDTPIIISDYLHVTHGFFDQGESKLINATLDRVARAARTKADS